MWIGVEIVGGNVPKWECLSALYNSMVILTVVLIKGAANTPALLCLFDSDCLMSKLYLTGTFITIYTVTMFIIIIGDHFNLVMKVRGFMYISYQW